MGSERTAEQAHSRMDTHEAVCSERYKSIERGLNDVKALLLAEGSEMHERLNALTKDMNARMNVISHRMWTAVTGSLGFAVVSLGTLVIYLLTKGSGR